MADSGPSFFFPLPFFFFFFFLYRRPFLSFMDNRICGTVKGDPLIALCVPVKPRKYRRLLLAPS